MKLPQAEMLGEYMGFLFEELNETLEIFMDQVCFFSSDPICYQLQHSWACISLDEDQIESKKSPWSKKKMRTASPKKMPDEKCGNRQAQFLPCASDVDVNTLKLKPKLASATKFLTDKARAREPTSVTARLHGHSWKCTEQMLNHHRVSGNSVEDQVFASYLL